MSPLDLNNIPCTKVICTLGPPSTNKEALRGFVEQGATIMRINMSHGSREEHKASIEMIREVSLETGRYVAVAIDTRGPEHRIQIEKELSVGKGDLLRIYQEGAEVPQRVDGAHVIPTSICDVSATDVGSVIILGDSVLYMVVQEVHEDYFLARARNGYKMTKNMSITFPFTPRKGPFLQEKDIEDIHFYKALGIDAIFLSFVESPDDVMELRNVVGHSDIVVVSKLETQPAINRLEEIIDASDAVMIARGDLCVNLTPEKMFSTQKYVSEFGYLKPVIMATELMSSMTRSPHPTRSEISDVGNAVLDGCSALLLSSETSIGDYVVDCVRMVTRIALDAENYVRTRAILHGMPRKVLTNKAVEVNSPREARPLLLQAGLHPVLGESFSYENFSNE